MHPAALTYEDGQNPTESRATSLGRRESLRLQMSASDEQLDSVLAGFVSDPQQRLSAVIALQQLFNGSRTAPVEGAEIDLGRAARCGFPEVVYGEGKPAELIVRVFRQQQAAGQPSLATRVSEDQASSVCQEISEVRHNAVARTLTLNSSLDDDQRTPQVAVVTAGSCDASVAEEALETLRWMNVPAVLIADVGVAGPQRLLKQVPLLQRMKAVVCVAGMEAALPSVLGGHVSCPVIGVPTSVGYGASLGGITALLSMLTCCASNVVAVNIDGGFRGGYVAGIVATSGSNPELRSCRDGAADD